MHNFGFFRSWLPFSCLQVHANQCHACAVPTAQRHSATSSGSLLPAPLRVELRTPESSRTSPFWVVLIPPRSGQARQLAVLPNIHHASSPSLTLSPPPGLPSLSPPPAAMPSETSTHSSNATSPMKPSNAFNQIQSSELLHQDTFTEDLLRAPLAKGP